MSSRMKDGSLPHGLGTEPAEIPVRKDNWSDLEKPNLFRCMNCVFYLNTRCKRHAPVAGYGYPMVYPYDLSCGDLKPTKKSMGGY